MIQDTIAYVLVWAVVPIGIVILGTFGGCYIYWYKHIRPVEKAYRERIEHLQKIRELVRKARK